MNNFSVGPLSRTSSTDTITAPLWEDNSVLYTPRNTFLNLVNPNVMVPADNTVFNFNPANPNFIPDQHQLELRLAARQS